MTTTRKPKTATQTMRERALARTRPTLTLTLCDTPEAKADLEAARYTLRRAQGEAADHPDSAQHAMAVTRAGQDVEAAQAAFDEVAIVLRFEALTRAGFDQLKAAHPPTEQQAEDGYAINPDTLGPELIAAASLDGITVDDARQMLDTWSDGDAAALFNAAWQVQLESRADVGKG